MEFVKLPIIDWLQAKSFSRNASLSFCPLKGEKKNQWEERKIGC